MRAKIAGWDVEQKSFPFSIRYSRSSTNFIHEIDFGKNSSNGNNYARVTFVSNSHLAVIFCKKVKDLTGDFICGSTYYRELKTAKELSDYFEILNNFLRENSSPLIPDELIQDIAEKLNAQSDSAPQILKKEEKQGLTSSLPEKQNSAWEVNHQNSALLFKAPANSIIKEIIIGPARGIALQAIFSVKSAFQSELEEFIKEKTGKRQFFSYSEQFGRKKDLDAFFAIIEKFLKINNEALPDNISGYAYRKFSEIYENNSKSLGYPADLISGEVIDETEAKHSPGK